VSEKRYMADAEKRTFLANVIEKFIQGIFGQLLPQNITFVQEENPRALQKARPMRPDRSSHGAEYEGHLF